MTYFTFASATVFPDFMLMTIGWLSSPMVISWQIFENVSPWIIDATTPIGLLEFSSFTGTEKNTSSFPLTSLTLGSETKWSPAIALMK